MSKIGRKPIAIESAKIAINGTDITIQGAKAQVSHNLPAELVAVVDGNSLKITVKENTRHNRMLWGLHRALLANKVQGVEKGFTQVMRIVGLGYKAQLTGRKLTFSLGYSHKKEVELPAGVEVELDKTGQSLTFKSTDKFLLGNTCDAVRSLRPPEPYKGTGIMLDGERIIRKAGKTKSA